MVALLKYLKVVKVVIYSPDVPEGSLDFRFPTRYFWNSLFHSLISVHYLQLMPFTHYLFFVPPGTHYCWVTRGGVD